MNEIQWTKEEIRIVVLAGVTFVTGVVMTLAAVAVLAWLLGYTDPVYHQYDAGICESYQQTLVEKTEYEDPSIDEVEKMIWLCVESRPNARLIINLINFYDLMLEDYHPTISQ